DLSGGPSLRVPGRETQSSVSGDWKAADGYATVSARTDSEFPVSCKSGDTACHSLGGTPLDCGRTSRGRASKTMASLDGPSNITSQRRLGVRVSGSAAIQPKPGRPGPTAAHGHSQWDRPP